MRQADRLSLASRVDSFLLDLGLLLMYEQAALASEECRLIAAVEGMADSLNDNATDAEPTASAPDQGAPEQGTAAAVAGAPAQQQRLAASARPMSDDSAYEGDDCFPLTYAGTLQVAPDSADSGLLHPLLSPKWQPQALRLCGRLLHFACSKGWTATARLVEEFVTQTMGASLGDVAAVASTDVLPGVTLLHSAVLSGRAAMVEQMLRWAADEGMTWNWSAAGPGCCTPLHLAAALPDQGTLAMHLMASVPGLPQLWFAAPGPADSTPATWAEQHGLGCINDMAAMADVHAGGSLRPITGDLDTGAVVHGAGGVGGAGTIAGRTLGLISPMASPPVSRSMTAEQVTLAAGAAGTEVAEADEQVVVESVAADRAQELQALQEKLQGPAWEQRGTMSTVTESTGVQGGRVLLGLWSAAGEPSQSADGRAASAPGAAKSPLQRWSSSNQLGRPTATVAATGGSGSRQRAAGLAAPAVAVLLLLAGTVALLLSSLVLAPGSAAHVSATCAGTVAYAVALWLLLHLFRGRTPDQQPAAAQLAVEADAGAASSKAKGLSSCSSVSKK